MDKLYLSAKQRAKKGSHRQEKIVSIRIPERVKILLDNWKSGYESVYHTKVTYEQMLQWWMDNIGYTEGLWDKNIRDVVSNSSLLFINLFKSKADIVEYLNKNGYFWEYHNQASDKISDDEVIFKSLLYLKFEDMPQLFLLFGKARCQDVFNSRISNQGEYYSIITLLLNVYFFE